MNHRPQSDLENIQQSYPSPDAVLTSFLRRPRAGVSPVESTVSWETEFAEKHFEGCGGLEVTDEGRVTIAAQACVLLLHRETDDYPHLGSILVYPTTYLVREGRRTADGITASLRGRRTGIAAPRAACWRSPLHHATQIAA